MRTFVHIRITDFNVIGDFNVVGDYKVENRCAFYVIVQKQ